MLEKNFKIMMIVGKNDGTLILYIVDIYTIFVQNIFIIDFIYICLLNQIKGNKEAGACACCTVRKNTFIRCEDKSIITCFFNKYHALARGNSPTQPADHWFEPHRVPIIFVELGSGFGFQPRGLIDSKSSKP
jgi:hypothetical protein